MVELLLVVHSMVVQAEELEATQHQVQMPQEVKVVTEAAVTVVQVVVLLAVAEAEVPRIITVVMVIDLVVMAQHLLSQVQA